MLTGLDEYLSVGGRLVYLGGNGFYWVTICPAGRTDTIEVRRGRSGTRVWESAPGEEHHAFRDERGGAWRNRGWAPRARRRRWVHGPGLRRLAALPMGYHCGAS